MSIDPNKFTSYQKNLGERLKSIRESKGYSLTDLASLCDLEKTAISRIENGRTNITFKTAIVLCTALKIELKYFFDISINQDL
ncbi:helix-turn-helix transcriptional regulator [Chryseobacterium sp. JJR-5R]|uniref:helix-turn-helix domain-containing protein n=1 Tax=Chryseobacterium sp. JJR-5R TaxID=3093923 RepID=UPI002A74950B|nr:helix-turn-helix transcriptional regulator [Chryseobacterium sp. JJR-5R]WPO83444.1 helix-turn-helix transcriptional regulator [Chryseobacterium sp. JJR-5R]